MTFDWRLANSFSMADRPDGQYTPERQRYACRFGHFGALVREARPAGGCLAKMRAPHIIVVLCERGAETFAPYDVIRHIHNTVAIEVAGKNKCRRLDRE